MAKTYLYASLWKEHGGAPGLGVVEFDPETGALSNPRLLNQSVSFNCSKVDSKRNLMYVSNEIGRQEDTTHRTGRIYGFRLDGATGGAEELFHRDTWSPNPSYLNLDPTGRYMVVTHHCTPEHVTQIVQDEDGTYRPVDFWNDSAVELFRVNEDGTLGALVDVVKHVPDRPVKDRFGRPGNCHPHCAVFSPSGKWIAVCDKGDSYVYLYSIDYEREKLILGGKYLTESDGSAPRYCAFHPTLPYLYINHEHAQEGQLNVSVFRYWEDGRMERVQLCSAIPEDYVLQDGHYEQQGFCIHPNGKYLYTILHGFNSVGVFSIDQETGKIQRIQNAEIQGEWPRGGALSPDGRFFLTSCLASGDIASYAVGGDGRLTPTGSSVRLHGCSYMSFYLPKD
ncbi:MAG: lactonase family protein [Candidatus Onthomonas sp.]